MKFSLLKSASLMSVILLTTTACAQQSATDTIKNNVNQAPQNSASIQSTQATSSVSKAVDSQLRQLLSQAGIKTQITSIVPSKLPNMYQVNLAGQPPLHITKEGKYVIQGELQKNPSKRVVTKTPARSSSLQVGKPVSASLKSDLLANMGALKNMSAKTPFFYTAVPGVIWGATLEGVPFLLSDDGQYITDGEISVIENG
ncbi:hypothetical protein I3247_05500, partial [Psychrobacter sp. Ps5]|nr:hypothetical protein [Psychrobacter sp. Ps5]